MIGYSKDLNKLGDLFHGYKSKLDVIHLSAFIQTAAEMISTFRSKRTKFGWLIEEVTGMLLERLQELGPRELSNLVASWAKVGFKPDKQVALVPVMSAFFKQSQSTDAVTAQDISTLALALSEMDVRDGMWVNRLRQMAEEKLERFPPKGLATLLLALARFGHAEPSFLSQWCTVAGRKVRAFNSQDFANSLWSLATLEHRDHQFVRELCLSIENRNMRFKHMEISSSLWAMAKMRFYDPVVVERLCQSTLTKDFYRITPQSISNVLWALANMGHRNEDFILVLCNETLHKLPDFNPQALSNTAWALQKLQIDDEKIIESVANAAMRRFIEYKPEEFSSVFLSLAQMGGCSDVFVRRWAWIAKRRAQRYGPWTIRDSIRALVLVDWQEDELLTKLVDCFLKRAEEAKPMDWVYLVSGTAALAFTNVPLVRQMLEHLEGCCDSLLPTDIITTLDALVVYRGVDPKLINQELMGRLSVRVQHLVALDEMPTSLLREVLAAYKVLGLAPPDVRHR